MSQAEVIIIGIQAARELIASLTLQAELARNNGQISDAELARIKAEGQLSDQRRDELVEQAKARLRG